MVAQRCRDISNAVLLLMAVVAFVAIPGTAFAQVGGESQVCVEGSECSSDQDCSSHGSEYGCYNDTCCQEPNKGCFSDDQCGDCEQCTDDQECVAIPGCCSEDGDCAGDQVCNNNQCVECTSDAQCSGCQTCSGNTCVDDNSECTGCESCSSGSCLSDNTQCGGDEICTGTTCVECTVNSHCPDNLKCSGQNECVECTASGDCDGCQVCSGNSCVDSDSQCSDDQVCDGGSCVGCVEDGDCPAGLSCADDTCVECLSDGECDGCETCNSGSCIDNDSQCGTDQLCQNASCVECVADKDCTGCETCNGGSCTDNSNECGPGEQCDKGSCVDCLSNADCPDSSVCQNNLCVECTDDSHCLGCQGCSDDNTCVDDSSACSGCQTCNGGACADDSNNCPDGEICRETQCMEPFDPVTELEDDFNSSWQECLWRPYQRRGGTLEYRDWDGTDQSQQIRGTDGKLELAIPAETGGGLSQDFGLESKFLLGGDFQAEVDYEMADESYYTNLDMRGVNMLFVELMAGEEGTRRRHVRNTGFSQDDEEQGGQPAAHLWLSNPNDDRVTQIDTDARDRLREIEVGQRPNRTAVDLDGNVYVHNRGRGYSNQWNPAANTETTITFIKASACADPECDLSQEDDHIYTLDISGGEFGGNWYNGLYGGGLAVDRNNDLWYGNRRDGILFHFDYIPSDVPGGDEWQLVETYDLSDDLGRNIRIYGLALSRDGNVWAATRGSSPEAFVELNPSSGQVTEHPLPASMAGSCVSTYGIAIDAEQRLFWSTLGGGNSSCTPYRYDPNEPDQSQAWIALDSNPGAAKRGSRGMAVDAEGRVWNAGDHRSEIVAFDTDSGDMVMRRNTCQNPIGVALDRNNLLWVSCFNDNFDNRVQYFDSDGQYLGNVGSVRTYTYSDMTGYQLRNFGLDDWEESFSVDQTVSSNEYYLSTVENNYGGGIEAGAGRATSLNPALAPFTITSGASVMEAQRMAVSTYYQIGGIYRILEHPLYLEGLWGLRTEASADLGAAAPAITMEEDGYVYVAFDERAGTVPAWLAPDQGWSELGSYVYTTDPALNNKLYRQHFDAGETVQFGGTDGADNYFVYVQPDALEADAPDSPDAIIDEPGSEVVSTDGTLRIERSGSDWTYSYRDGGSGPWQLMERSGGSVSDVPIRLRVRLDPFWHSGSRDDLGSELVVRYDNFAVNYADNVPGSPYCREGCDETFAGYGSSCLGGTLGLCPGTMACNSEEDALECIPEPGTESCNGLDNDCDGFIDHNAAGSDFPGQFVSQSGEQYWVDDYGMPGVDANSGATVSEGSSCSSELAGPCEAGYQECVGGVMTCQSFVKPQPEQCDGVDNSCDGSINEDRDDPIVQIGHYVQAGQRSTPSAPVRPLGGTDKPSFTDWVNFDGFNVDPPEEDLIEEGMARVSLYVQTAANGEPQYVLYLSHGDDTSGQGAVTASYHFQYFGDASAMGLFLQDGVVDERSTDHSNANNQRSQQIFVETGATQTGGVAIGPFSADEQWSVDINAEFAGHVDGWQLYNAATGDTMELTANEVLTLSNMDLAGLGGALTSETGTSCNDPVDFLGMPSAPGICSNGMLRCEEQDGEWDTRCWSDVTPQMEVCDGRDNSCSGDVDGPLDDLTFPVVMLDDGDETHEVATVDTAQSAVDFMNFQQRSSGQPRVGSPEILDVTDQSGNSTIQEVDSSVMTVHRNTTQYSGNMSLALAHGRYVEGDSGDIPNRERVNMRIGYDGAATEEESYPVWFVDIAEQEDGGDQTDADALEYNRGQQQYFGEWQLHRWVESNTARREADGGVISDIFTELDDDTELSIQMQSNQLDNWRYYSPYLEDDTNYVDIDSNRVDLSIQPRKYGDAACVIQENEVASCLGTEDIYTCQDGQVTCGLGGAGCCEPSHPMYGEECDNPVNPPAGLEAGDYNTGACRAEMRCDSGGAWECVQVQAPEPEMCDGQDNTCDGLVDGMVSGFENYDDDGELIDTQDCPDGAETCGPEACGFEQICGCPGGDCRCIPPLSDRVSGPADRICAANERLADEQCEPVCSSSRECPQGQECRHGQCE